MKGQIMSKNNTQKYKKRKWRFGKPIDKGRDTDDISDFIKALASLNRKTTKEELLYLLDTQEQLRTLAKGYTFSHPPIIECLLDEYNRKKA